MTQANTLGTSIETTQREIENPTEVELELKRRLDQLTDHLIQKQAQVPLFHTAYLWAGQFEYR